MMRGNYFCKYFIFAEIFGPLPPIYCTTEVPGRRFLYYCSFLYYFSILYVCASTDSIHAAGQCDGFDFRLLIDFRARGARFHYFYYYARQAIISPSGHQPSASALYIFQRFSRTTLHFYFDC